MSNNMKIPSIFFNPSCNHPLPGQPATASSTPYTSTPPGSDGLDWSFTYSSSEPDCTSQTLVEAIIRDVSSSERFIFEPRETRSILNKEEMTMAKIKVVEWTPFEEGVAVALEEFKKSMQAMEEMNAEDNHRVIVGDFTHFFVKDSTLSSANSCLEVGDDNV